MSANVRVSNSDKVVTIVTDFQTAANGALSKTIPAAGANTRGYLTSVVVTGLGATAGAAAALTITGAGSATITGIVGVPAGATVPLAQHSWYFDPPLPAAAANAAITVAVGAFGSGNTMAGMVITGYTQPDS